MKRQIPLTLLALLAILSSLVPAALAQGPTPPPPVAPEKASEEETALDAPQRLFRAGPLAVSYVYTNSTPLAIPDAGCPNYVVSTINVPDSFSIGDLNVGVWIAHTWRSDLDMYLQGPDGTTVELYTDPDGSADNINVLFDESSPNLVADSVDHSPPPPYYYVTWNPEGNLDNFNFKNAQGTWTFMVCDDAGGDTGTLNTWTLFFRTGLLLNPEAQSGGACRGSDVTYTFQVVNTTGVTQSFSLTYTSTWPVSGPSSTPMMPNNSTWSFDVTVHVPWASNPGDSDVLTVTASGGGDTAQATATTLSELARDWQDYANMPAGREVRAPSVVYYDGKLYVIGGYGYVGGTGAARPWVSIYDIANNSWSIGADMPAGRYWINCEQLFDPNDNNRPKIYCAGGYLTARTDTLYIYDIGNNSWTTGPTLPAARYDYASVKLDNKYYVIGGYTTTYENTMLVYDPATNSWDSSLAPMNVARRYFHAGVIGGKIYVAGGYNPSYLSSAEVYDPINNTWTYVASMPMPWVNGADGVKHDRFLVIAGGSPSSTAGASNGALVYDALTDTWSWLPLLDHLIYGAEGDTDGDGEFWYVTGRLYEAGNWLNSPYTTKLIQCGPCEGVHDVDFSVYPPVPRHNRPATFTASAIGSPVITYEWDFGDGDYGSGQVVEHTYTYTGTFTVVMTATNCDGADQVVVSHDVQVVAAPMIVVSPEALSSVQCPDAVATQTLSICNLGSADLVFTITEVPGLSWLSEDPTTGTVPPGGCQDVTVTFDSTGLTPGDYTGTLRIDNNDILNPVVNVPVTLTVAGPPTNVDFTWNPAFPVAGEEVSFQGSADALLPVEYTWDFGDGETGSGQFVEHTYRNWGFYTVTMFATVCDFTVSATHRITVTLCQNLLEEHFEGDFPPAGWTVLNNGGNCVWQRNDQWSPARPNYAGGQGYCADADSDRCGSGTTMDTELRTPSFDLSGATAATLRYMAAYNWWASGEFANTDISTDGGNTWTTLLHWAEDHSPYGPGEAVELDLGPYLTQTNVMVRFHYYAPGWDYYWEVDQVAVVACSGPPGCVPPAGSAFTWSPISPLVGEEVAFTGTAGMATGPLTYEWAFGDGDYGSGWRVAHTYTSPGDYTVVMTVTNGCGQEVVTATLTVGNPPNIVVTPESLFAEQCPNTVTTQTLSICNTGDFTLTWSLSELTQTFRLAGWKPVERPTTYLPEAVADLAHPGEPAGASTPALGTTWSYPQAVLWDNGPLVTHQDACAGGTQDASRLQTGLGMNTLGFGHQFANGYRMSDDFTIADPGGWQIDTITFFAYQTGAPMSPSPITGVYLQIWNGPPWVVGSSVVWGDLTTNRLLSSTFSGIQRDSETSPCPNNRYIFANVAQVGVWLPPGQYWLDWTTDGNPSYTGPWAPPITILGQTTTGDAYQYTTAWAPALDSGTSTQQGMPFVIEGSVVPAADVPWLSENPTSGTVPGGGCQDVVITFDSTGLLPGDYFAGLRIESNDPDTPTLTVPVTLTVLEPVSADFAWAPTSPLIGEPVYFTATASGAAPITYVWAFGDGSYGSGQYVSHTYAEAGPYVVTLTATNVCGPVVVTHTLTVIGYPDIGVTPESLESTQCPDTLVTQPITICNVGDVALEWSLSEIPGLGIQAASPPVRSGSPLARRPVVLSAAPLDGVSVPTHPPVVNAPVSLVLDDGTIETAIGIGGTWEFIWLNRFTPAPDDFPFVLNQVWVYFPSFGNVHVGDDILIAIYENTTGGFDPAPGSNWLFSYATTVQALDTWSVYTLPTPVPLYGPGDVLIGVIGLEVPGTNYYPAALDRTASQQRSWAGWWSVSPPPEPPLLPPDDAWILIDNYFPGNWMVRGYGETLEDVPWLSEEPTSGTVLPGMCQVVTVTFDSTGMAAGDYFARLLIQSNDPDEPRVSVPVTMTVNPLPEASFDYEPSSGYAPLTVTFTDTSQYAQNPTWDFGDGGTGSGAVVTHTYTTAGDFVVTLTVESPYGCGTDTYTATVHVVAPGLPIAGFESSSPDCLGETTYFTNTSQNATSYLWNFGDGITSTLENPVHTYAAAGTYTVWLTATNAQGSDRVSHDVVILAAPAGADFTWTPAEPVVGEAVTFTGTVEAGSEPLTYAWAFGDGGTGSGQTVSHTYSEAGTYTVLLTVTNACGEAYATHDIVVVAPPCEEPSGADFSWWPPTPLVDEEVTFTGSATGGTQPFTWEWAFGDGTYGSGQVVTHTYTTAGDYTVVMTVSNACGFDTATYVVHVAAGCEEPTGADFTWTPASPYAGQTAYFTATLAGGTAPLTFTWDFGDDTSGSGRYVSHVYAAAGTYTVTLTATNPCGQATATRSIVVRPTPPTYFYVYLPLVFKGYTFP